MVNYGTNLTAKCSHMGQNGWGTLSCQVPIIMVSILSILWFVDQISLELDSLMSVVPYSPMMLLNVILVLAFRGVVREPGVTLSFQARSYLQTIVPQKSIEL